jgi:hypothetical protein
MNETPVHSTIKYVVTSADLRLISASVTPKRNA